MTNRKITVKNAFGGKAMNILGTEQLQNELENLRQLHMAKCYLQNAFRKSCKADDDYDAYCKHALENVDYMILENAERLYHIYTDIEFEKAMKVKSNE